MADLHDALKALSPVENNDLPLSPEALTTDLASRLAATRTLISSIPPPTTVPQLPNYPNTVDTDPELSKHWKPVKISPKDNPENISVWKLSAKDGRGAWFARRSVHTDIPFSRFRAGLQNEFALGKEEEGGSVRGIGAETKLAGQTCGIGSLNVFRLRAQFPAVAEREFVQGQFASSAKPEEIADGGQAQKKEGGDGEQEEGGPRQFTTMSRPVLNHPECPERAGLVRGTYESMEFIREIPVPAPNEMKRAQSTPSMPTLASTQSAGRKRGKTIGEADEADKVLPAVDWLMITRSDPGGNVPRWMVERGTPNGIVKDAEKFLNWVRAKDELEDEIPATEAEEHEERAQGQEMANNEDLRRETKKHLADGRASDAAIVDEAARGELSPPPYEEINQRLARHASQPRSPGPPPPQQNYGVFSNALSMLAGGLTSLASSAVGASTSANPTPPTSSESEPEDDDKSVDGKSLDEKSLNEKSANEKSPAPEKSLGKQAIEDANDAASVNTFETAASEDSINTTPSITSTTAPSTNSKGMRMTPEEQALHRFQAEKAKLEARMEKEKSRAEAKDQKTREKHLRELEKREKKYQRAMEKAEEKNRKRQEKEARKERKNPAHAKEVEDLKKVVEGLTFENMQLKERVNELEKLAATKH